MFKERDRVILAKDIPEFELKIGDLGTVVMVHSGGHAFEVEFMTLDGKTITVATLKDSDVRQIRKMEIANARIM